MTQLPGQAMTRLDDALAQRDHWKNVSRRLLADLDGIRRNIESFEKGLTVEGFEATITADDVQLIGWCRVLCEIALEDHAGLDVPRVERPTSRGGME